MMPLVMASVTLISRRWGNSIGGLVAGLPWIAGPIFLFFCIEQGVPFALNSLKGSMIGSVCIIPFIYTYIYASKARTWPLSLLLAYCSFLMAAFFLNRFASYFSLTTWYVFNVAMATAALYFFPSVSQNAQNPKSLKYEIPLRMVVITAFVIALTYLANVLGPAWSGILTPFPVITAILAAFTHYAQGSFGVANILKGILYGFIGFVTFLYLQSHFLNNFSIAVSLGLAVFINLCINISIRLILKNLDKKRPKKALSS